MYHLHEDDNIIIIIIIIIIITKKNNHRALQIMKGTKFTGIGHW
jgi:hypothetical protein